MEIQFSAGKLLSCVKAMPGPSHYVIPQSFVPVRLVPVLVDVAIHSDAGEGGEGNGDDGQSDNGLHNLVVGTVTDDVETLHLEMYQFYHA